MDLDKIREVITDSGEKIIEERHGNYNGIDYIEIKTSGLTKRNFFVCEKGVSEGYGKTFERVYQLNEEFSKKYKTNGWMELWQFAYSMSLD